MSSHFQRSGQQPGHHTFLGSSSQTACIQITSKSKGFSLPNTARMSLFLTASTVTVLAKPASHWEKKTCEQARRGLHPTPSILNRSNAGLLIGLSLQKTLVPLGLCACYSLHLKAFLLCVLLPPVPLLRESVTKHPVELFCILLFPILFSLIFSPQHVLSFDVSFSLLPYFFISPRPTNSQETVCSGWGLLC